MPNSLARNVRTVASTISDACHGHERSAMSGEGGHLETYARRIRAANGAESPSLAFRGQGMESVMSSRWIISARPTAPKIWAMSREVRPRMRSACRAS